MLLQGTAIGTVWSKGFTEDLSLPELDNLSFKALTHPITGKVCFPLVSNLSKAGPVVQGLSAPLLQLFPSKPAQKAARRIVPAQQRCGSDGFIPQQAHLHSCVTWDGFLLNKHLFGEAAEVSPESECVASCFGTLRAEQPTGEPQHCPGCPSAWLKARGA